MGKGDKRRPALISPEEEELRWDLAYGKITKVEFDVKMEELEQRKTNGNN
ncbi:MAG: hypothetical protein PH343_05600 [Nitrospira sp.]|nr:hypothetical protein [Nitrospira sp.]